MAESISTQGRTPAEGEGWPAMGSVLVASDLRRSRSIIRFAARVARSADARLFLLHVVEPTSAGHVPRHVRASQFERRRRNCDRALRLEANELEAAGTRVTTGLVIDRPVHEAILERIRTTDAGIVVVGSTARRGRGRLLGSTADRLLRSSPVPCLIVRGRAVLPVKRAAAATDFSSRSRLAIRLAVPWIEAIGEGDAHLDLLHVGDRSSLDVDPSLQTSLEESLGSEVRRMEGDPHAIRMGTRLYFGEHPVDTIVEATAAEGYQLLVAGTHGHGPVRRALIGSVAMGLAQSAPCPVLIVPPRASGR